MRCRCRVCLRVVMSSARSRKRSVMARLGHMRLPSILPVLSVHHLTCRRQEGRAGSRRGRVAPVQALWQGPALEEHCPVSLRVCRRPELGVGWTCNGHDTITRTRHATIQQPLRGARNLLLFPICARHCSVPLVDCGVTGLQSVHETGPATSAYCLCWLSFSSSTPEYLATPGALWA